MTRRVFALPVAWLSAAAFLLVFAGLALALRHGRDPVLGAGRSQPVAVAPRRVLLRRIVVRRVIVRVIPAPSPLAAASAAGTTPVTASAPVATSAPAPAPVPAPARPVTRSS